MPVIELHTRVAAPIERVFDLSRSVELHLDSTRETGEQAIAGTTSGLLHAGDTVTWRARHLGFWQTMTVGILEMDRPRHFADAMARGPFRRMRHDHYFAPEANGVTQMRDVFAYESPLRWLGRLADALFLTRYLRRLLEKRNHFITHAAESDIWQKYLPPPGPPENPPTSIQPATPTPRSVSFRTRKPDP